MPDTTSKSPSSTNFRATVTSYLTDRGMTQAALARVAGKDPKHMNHVIRGTYSKPTASWADIIANALELPDEDRRKLHRAAALDQGFKL